MEAFLLIVLGYISGSVLFGEILARLKGVNLREVGSGNVGATNVARALGKRYGALVFLLDMLKGLIPTYVGFRVMGVSGIEGVLLGLAPVLGHMFPVFFGFRGGKGVATAFGVLLSVSPVVAILSFCVWIGVVLTTRFVSLGSITASSSAPLFLALTGHSVYTVSMGILIALLIVLRHRSNIVRLLRGEEHRV